jgi:hypothetical protein
MTGDRTRRDIEVLLEQALDEAATTTVPAGRRRPPYPMVELNRPGLPVRHPRLHRRWAGPLLIAAVLLVVTLGVSQLPTLSSHRHQPATAVPSTSAPTPQPSVSSTVSVPTSSPATPTRTRSSAPTAVDPRTIDLANAVIDIPSTQPTDCRPSGRRQFLAGKATTAGSLWYWWLGPRLRYANLDEQAGDEVLATVTCADSEVNPSFLLVLKVAPDHSLRTLGLLNLAGSQLLQYDPDTIQIQGSTVLVEVMGPVHGPGYGPLANKQVRGYAYSGGQFVQVSGPTSFPPLPKTVVGVDLANTTLSVLIGCRPPSCQHAWVRFVNGTGQAALVPDGALSTFSQGQASLAKDAAGKVIAIMPIRWTLPDGTQHSGAFAISSTGDLSPLSAETLALSGSDGITTVRSAFGSPNSDVVTVVADTAQGSQTRKYQAPQYSGDPWRRIS